MIEFKLPSLGSDMDEGTLLEWKVAPGDPVKRGQIVAVVDTSKSAVEIESWHEGTVFELLRRPGEKFAVGTVMARLLEAGESPETVQPAASPARPALVQTAPPGLRKAASPAARKRARELNVDIDALEGSGPHGAVSIEDVEKAAGRRPAALERTAEMRKAIAAAMSRSKREIPHYYLAETIAMRRATQWLTQYNAERPVAARMLMGALQLKAVALALKRCPELNGFWQEGGFRPAAGIHIGVAISLRQGGLLAPAIHDVDRLLLPDLMHALADLVQRTRAGSLKSSEMSDPTITVTNLGDQGVDSVFGVIYPPQVALVGFGRLVERPWAEDGALRAAPVVTASLAADHRVSDGHRGALFLNALSEQLQHPEAL